MIWLAIAPQEEEAYSADQWEIPSAAAAAADQEVSVVWVVWAVHLVMVVWAVTVLLAVLVLAPIHTPDPHQPTTRTPPRVMVIQVVMDLQMHPETLLWYHTQLLAVALQEITMDIIKLQADQMDHL